MASMVGLGGRSTFKRIFQGLQGHSFAVRWDTTFLHRRSDLFDVASS